MAIKTLLFGLVFVAFFGLWSSAAKAQYDPFEDVCTGSAASSPTCQQKKAQEAAGTNPVAGPGGIISDAANIIALVGGIAAVIIIIISGFVFVTAGVGVNDGSGGSTPRVPVQDVVADEDGGQRAGDSPTRAKNARTVLVGAVIGLVVIALGWSITTFIINTVIK